MLSVHYKILAKVILNRIKGVSSEIINPNQTCSVPERNIMDGVSTVTNALEQDESALLLSVDHKQAFHMIIISGTSWLKFSKNLILQIPAMQMTLISIRRNKVPITGNISRVTAEDASPNVHNIH